MFFLNVTATSAIYTDGHPLSPHDVLPIYWRRCNSVHPGGVHTRMLYDFAALTGDAEAALLKLNAANPLGRVGLPLDIANGVLYLASDLSAWVTGLELVIDGGSTL